MNKKEETDNKKIAELEKLIKDIIENDKEESPFCPNLDYMINKLNNKEKRKVQNYNANRKY